MKTRDYCCRVLEAIAACKLYLSMDINQDVLTRLEAAVLNPSRLGAFFFF